jgi:hypothetical protein
MTISRAVANPCCGGVNPAATRPSHSLPRAPWGDRAAIGVAHPSPTRGVGHQHLWLRQNSFEYSKETRPLASSHHPVIESQRQRKDAADDLLVLLDNDALLSAAGAYNCDLRRHDNQTPDHAKIRQGYRGAA